MPPCHIATLASYFYFAQQVLSTLNGNGNGNSGNSTSGAGGDNSTLAASNGLASVTDFSSLVTLLFSLGALRDWLKLIVFGGVLETLRRMAFSLCSFYFAYVNLKLTPFSSSDYRIIASFWITAHFDENDSSYGLSLEHLVPTRDSQPLFYRLDDGLVI